MHVDVVDAGDGASRADDFDVLRVDHDMLAERERIARYLDVPLDKTLALVAEMDFEEPDDGGPVAYVCPMHPEIVRDARGKCPKCGMKLMASHADADSGAGSVPHHHDDADAMTDGIGWKDLMPEVNRTTTPATMRWELIDRDTAVRTRTSAGASTPATR